MIQPVELQDFLLTFFAAAGIILSGACYALLFAWGRLSGRRSFLALAYAAYAVLAGSVWVLAETAHLLGYWRALAVAMVAGYFAAPRAVFRLCVATHGTDETDSSHSTHSQSEDLP
jgi:ABC-type multidrug transport system permease subunit